MNVISVITIIMSHLNVSVVYSIVAQDALITFTSWMKSYTALCVDFNINIYIIKIIYILIFLLIIFNLFLFGCIYIRKNYNIFMIILIY